MYKMKLYTLKEEFVQVVRACDYIELCEFGESTRISETDQVMFSAEQVRYPVYKMMEKSIERSEQILVAVDPKIVKLIEQSVLREEEKINNKLWSEILQYERIVRDCNQEKTYLHQQLQKHAEEQRQWRSLTVWQKLKRVWLFGE